MMDRFIIEGGRPLKGEVYCSGSKNATLPLMAAALLGDGVTTIDSVPDLQDIRTMAMVLKVIGADVQIEDNRLRIDSSSCNSCEAPYELVRKMRASFYVLGPLVARFGSARVSLPGGCALGPRPVDLHIKALQRMGVRITNEMGYIIADAEKLKGCRIDLDIASVGATGNIMMAATAAEGKTEIHNAACEPDVKELADFLVKMGAEIHGAGTKHVEIIGPARMKAIDWKVIPDRIEAGSLAVAGAITGGTVTIRNCRPDHMNMFLNKLEETGVALTSGSDFVSIDADRCELKPVDITTEVYPGFPTDLQAPWTSLMCLASGSSVITEKIYPERFNHVPELKRLGADINHELNSIHIRGSSRLKAASIMCSDIRAAAALVIAALAAEGQTDILRIYHIDRGYDKIEDKLNSLGAKILRIRE